MLLLYGRTYVRLEGCQAGRRTKYAARRIESCQAGERKVSSAVIIYNMKQCTAHQMQLPCTVTRSVNSFCSLISTKQRNGDCVRPLHDTVAATAAAPAARLRGRPAGVGERPDARLTRALHIVARARRARPPWRRRHHAFHQGHFCMARRRLTLDGWGAERGAAAQRRLQQHEEAPRAKRRRRQERRRRTDGADPVLYNDPFVLQGPSTGGTHTTD